MKKMLTAVLAALMALCLILPAVAEGEVTIGQALYAAHGTKCFAVLTVAMQDGMIADAYIDEFQFMTAGEAVGVPQQRRRLRPELSRGQGAGLQARKCRNVQREHGRRRLHRGAGREL